MLMIHFLRLSGGNPWVFNIAVREVHFPLSSILYFSSTVSLDTPMAEIEYYVPLVCVGFTAPKLLPPSVPREE